MLLKMVSSMSSEWMKQQKWDVRMKLRDKETILSKSNLSRAPNWKLLQYYVVEIMINIQDDSSHHHPNTHPELASRETEPTWPRVRQCATLCTKWKPHGNHHHRHRHPCCCHSRSCHDWRCQECTGEGSCRSTAAPQAHHTHQAVHTIIQVQSIVFVVNFLLLKISKKSSALVGEGFPEAYWLSFKSQENGNWFQITKVSFLSFDLGEKGIACIRSIITIIRILSMKKLHRWCSDNRL